MRRERRFKEVTVHLWSSQLPLLDEEVRRRRSWKGDPYNRSMLLRQLVDCYLKHFSFEKKVRMGRRGERTRRIMVFLGISQLPLLEREVMRGWLRGQDYSRSKLLRELIDRYLGCFSAEEEVRKMKKMTRYWPQGIKVRDLRAKAREMKESIDPDRREMGTVILKALRGIRPGRYTFPEVTWNRSDLVQRAFSVAGEELLKEGY